jgi:predicted AlkP superfamily pyrophosphatase or phosphodiesterase
VISPILPRYGEASLSDLTPSLLASLGLSEFKNVLGLPPTRSACLLLFDGLGWEALWARQDEARFLASLLPSGRTLTAGFPSTTAASVASVGMGVPPGEHGVVGFTLALPGQSRAMNVLRWTAYGPGEQVDLLKKLDPELFQPTPSAFELAAGQGVRVALFGPAAHDHSGLSRAALRGGKFQAAASAGDLLASCLSALKSDQPVLVYGHHNDLDTTGHTRGVSSDAWRFQLRQVDRMCQTVVEHLPPNATLVITGDHGMVDLAPEQRLELDDFPRLKAGVRIMAGEGRARYLYTEHGAEQDVLGAWREALGDQMWILSRDEAIDAGWFGPVVTEQARGRIGDVIAAARRPVGMFQRAIDSGQAGLVGHHGSLTPEEMLVPLIVVSS